MRFSPPEDAIQVYSDGFAEDFLGRKPIAQGLSELLERIEDPLVIAMHGGWGTGKSYFLQRWVGAHKTQFGGSATTVYFDAFAHDFLEDPLIALVSAVADRAPSDKKKQVEKVKSLAWRLLRPAARISLSVATFGATEALSDLGDAVVEAVGGEAKDAIGDFWKREEGRRAAMNEFHDAVSSLMLPAESETPVPLVIVIDELDRCRPDYALQILEIIKHFFAVPRLHFVLGVNLDALENSVRARYGADIDARMYLQKFISLSFGLPQTLNDDTHVTVKFASVMGEKMGTPKRILTPLVSHLKVVSKSNSISMRDVSRMLSRMALLPNEVYEKDYLSGWIEVLCTLVSTSEIAPELNKKILSRTATFEDIKSYFGGTHAAITRKIGEAYNEDFDQEVTWRVYIWLYIIKNGNVDGVEEAKGAYTVFNHFPHRNPLSIPNTVQKDWLSLFKV